MTSGRTLPYRVFVVYKKSVDSYGDSPGFWIENTLRLFTFDQWNCEVAQVNDQRGLIYSFANPDHAFEFKMKFG